MIGRSCACGSWVRGRRTGESGITRRGTKASAAKGFAEGSGLACGQVANAAARPPHSKVRDKLALVAVQCRVELAARGEPMLPVHLQPESHVPLYVQLRDQLRALVHAGDLRPGDRIPASRELAVMFGVHRTTVANGYGGAGV